MAYTLVRLVHATPRLDLESFARAGRLHPELVRRMVVLGLLEASTDARGGLWFAPDQLHELARIQRLHADFPLDYAACGLVTALLDRIAALEESVRHARAHHTGG
jgi:chaperone modulatory protein CbpM